METSRRELSINSSTWTEIHTLVLIISIILICYAIISKPQLDWSHLTVGIVMIGSLVGLIVLVRYGGRIVGRLSRMKRAIFKS